MRILTALILLAATLFAFGCSGPQWKKDQSIGEFDFRKKMASDEGQMGICVEEFTAAKSIANPHVIGDARVGAFNVHAEVRSDDPA
jgi:hypothetical protein